jgi:hypothetical protein
LGQLAAQIAYDQGQQNQRIAESSRNLAEGSRQLVAADAQARRELIDLQQALRHDQTEIARQRDALEGERQSIARQRRTDSAIGSSVEFAGWLLASLSPLVLAAMALLGLWRQPTAEEEGDILVEQLAQNLADAPPTPIAVSNPRRAPRLPPPQSRSATGP